MEELYEKLDVSQRAMLELLEIKMKDSTDELKKEIDGKLVSLTMNVKANIKGVKDNKEILNA